MIFIIVKFKWIFFLLGNGGYKSSNIGSGGFKPTNSKNKSQEPVLDTKLKKQQETDEAIEPGSGAGGAGAGIDDDEGDDDDGDDEDVDNRPNPILPEEEEEDEGRSSINLNPKITSKTDFDTDNDDDDLITTVDQNNTDKISSKMKYFVNFGYKSICDLQHFQQKNYAKHIQSNLFLV